MRGRLCWLFVLVAASAGAVAARGGRAQTSLEAEQCSGCAGLTVSPDPLFTPVLRAASQAARAPAARAEPPQFEAWGKRPPKVNAAAEELDTVPGGASPRPLLQSMLARLRSLERRLRQHIAREQQAAALQGKPIGAETSSTRDMKQVQAMKDEVKMRLGMKNRPTPNPSTFQERERALAQSYKEVAAQLQRLRAAAASPPKKRKPKKVASGPPELNGPGPSRIQIQALAKNARKQLKALQSIIGRARGAPTNNSTAAAQQQQLRTDVKSGYEAVRQATAALRSDVPVVLKQRLVRNAEATLDRLRGALARARAAVAAPTPDALAAAKRSAAELQALLVGRNATVDTKRAALKRARGVLSALRGGALGAQSKAELEAQQRSLELLVKQYLGEHASASSQAATALATGRRQALEAKLRVLKLQRRLLVEEESQRRQREALRALRHRIGVLEKVARTQLKGKSKKRPRPTPAPRVDPVSKAVGKVQLYFHRLQRAATKEEKRKRDQKKR